MQKGVKEILTKISIKYKLDFDVIERIYISQFLGAKENLSTNDLLDETTFQNVRFKYLGTLRYDPRYTKRLCETRKLRLSDISDKELSDTKKQESPKDQ